MRSRKRKVRKPRNFSGATGEMMYIPENEIDGSMIVAINFMIGDPKDCRRLANWLEKAAAYLDSQGEK